MSDICKFKMILHFSNFEDIYYLKLFKQKKKIENKEITFEFHKDKFKQFQYHLPTKIFILDKNGKKIMNFTLNLLKDKNIYHLFSIGGNAELYELLFYNEEKVELIVDNEKINEYDTISKFKRFSLINICNNEIKVNDTIINLGHFWQVKNHKGNSFQLSFYDISQKYIVSKKIMKVQKMNFSIFYGKYINYLNKSSTELDSLRKKESEFKNNVAKFNQNWINIYARINDELNLNLPKKELEILINEDKYLDFIYLYIKLHMFFIFCKNNDKKYDDFIQLFNYLEMIFKQLKNDNDYKHFEKISILFHLTELFNIAKSCQLFLKSNFHYIKVDKVDKNSAIDLAITFLNTYIDNLNEESPQYFKLVEINSGIGIYKGQKIFTYDIIGIDELKSHLKEIIPSVICFYSLDDANNYAFTYPTIMGVCINKSKLFQHCETFSVDKNCFNERKFEVKNIAMKIALILKHECFGHIKFEFHPEFCQKPNSKTPKKCFDNKKLKELVGYNTIVKNNNINILTDNNKSDSGNYLESALGKLPGTKFYTSIYLSTLKNIGNLLDHPELFYRKENLEKLQKFAYYKHLYEKEIEKEEKYKEFNFDEEMEYLTNFFEKSSTLNKKEETIEITPKNPRKLKKLLKQKRKRTDSKKNDDISEIIQNEKEKINGPKTKKKRKTKVHKIMDRDELLNILINNNLTESQQSYYLKLFHETLYRE